VGSGGANGDRPLRAQAVVALVVGLLLLAVPLYLWRRPQASETPASASIAEAAIAVASSAASGVHDAALGEPGLTVGPIQRIRCSASPRARGLDGKQCDALPFFESALEKAVVATAGCAPRMSKSGTINHVLTIDFVERRLHMYPGQSGEWRGPQARKATRCVQQALPAPEWDKIPHQHRYYMLAVLATYPGSESRPTQADLPIQKIEP
jgi:hypothetical protein